MINHRQAIVIIYSVVLFICLNACHKTGEIQDQGDAIHIEIDPNNLPSPSPLSEIAEKVRLIPLETNPDCLITDVNRVFIGGKNILVVTSVSPQNLFLYTLDGKFVRKIGHQGQGPGEYTNISDITVFEAMEQVHISTGQSGDIIIYNFDGEFVRTIKGIKGSAFSKRIDPDRIAYTSYLDYEITIVNEKKENSLSLFPINPENIGFIFTHLYGSVKGGFFYSVMGKDIIWKFEHDSLVPAIVCHFGSGGLDQNEFIKYTITQRIPRGKFIIDGFPFYGGGYYHFLLSYEDKKSHEKAYDVLINEESHQSWFIEFSSESDDILFSDAVSFKNSAITGEMISVAYANDLINGLQKIKENKAFDYDAKIISQIEQLSDEDNPVLVLFTLK